MIIQCKPRIRLETPLGPGLALFFEDDGEEIWWTVALRSRAIVQFPNHKVLAAQCYTDGNIGDEEMRNKITKPLDIPKDAQ